MDSTGTDTKEKMTLDPIAGDLGALPVAYAGFWERLLAKVIDGLILAIPSVLISQALPVIGPIVLGLLYTPVLEASSLQATLGKRLMGIVVTDLQGARVTNRAALIRYILGYISALLLGIGQLVMLFSSRKQTAYDMVAETLVLKGKRDGYMYEAWIDQLKTWFKSGQ